MQNRQLKNSRRGMTLVELLVVAAIIGTLLAISIPLLKPMLESRKTSNAAQVLAVAFQQARMKSMQDGKSCGVRLVPFETAPSTAIQLRLQKGTPPPDFVNPPDVRVKVENGEIIPYRFSDSEWKAVKWSEVGKARDHFLLGYAVQFNHLGRFVAIEYIAAEDKFKLQSPYDGLNLPDMHDSNTMNDAMEYRITRLAVTALAWIPPVVMPRGTVVDLVFSGGETVGFDGGDKTSDGAPAFFAPGDDVVVMFSPAGHVDLLYINGAPRKVNEMLYFCVGEWDRQVDAGGNSLAEDKKTNLEAPATYWVSLHPKTGGTRIAENAPVRSNDPLEKLREARKFAREHFFDVGRR